MLNQLAIQEFKKIYFKKFGKNISDQEALELGIKLINLYKIIYQSKITEENEICRKKI